MQVAQLAVGLVPGRLAEGQDHAGGLRLTLLEQTPSDPEEKPHVPVARWARALKVVPTSCHKGIENSRSLLSKGVHHGGPDLYLL